MRHKMKLIVEMRYGSHLYGTATPLSDRDQKGVYLPDARDILLQRVRATLGQPRQKAPGEKNAAGSVDREIYGLQHYLELLAEGQMVALDMLFAPDAAMMREPSPLWREIQANAQRLVTRRTTSLLRYCRHQANRYGIMGPRLAAARQVLAMLAAAQSAHGTTARLAIAAGEITAFAATTGHASVLDLPMPGGALVRHLEVCGRKMPFTGSIKSARELIGRVVDAYGERARQAERNEGIDWKALSHAVRIGREALELLAAGRITLPLPCATEILAIKRGELPYETVSGTIETLLAEVETMASRSSLRDQPDLAFIDDLVARAYREQVAGDDADDRS